MREDIKDCAEMHGLFCIALVPDVTDRPHAVLSRIKLRQGQHGSVYTEITGLVPSFCLKMTYTG